MRPSDHSGFKAIGKTYRETRMKGLVARREEMIKETLEFICIFLMEKFEPLLTPQLRLPSTRLR